MEGDESFEHCSFCNKMFIKSRDEVFAFACPNCNDELANWANDIDLKRSFQRSLKEQPLTEAQIVAFGAPDWRPEAVLSDGTFPAQNVNWAAPFNTPAPDWMRTEAVNRTPTAASSTTNAHLMVQSPQTPTSIRGPFRSHRGSVGSSFSLNGMTYLTPRSNATLNPDSRQSEVISQHDQHQANRQLFEDIRYRDNVARAQAQRIAHQQQQEQQQQRLAQMHNEPQPSENQIANSTGPQYHSQQAAPARKTGKGHHFDRMTCIRCNKSQPITQKNDGITCTNCLRHLRKAEEKKNSLSVQKKSDASAVDEPLAAGQPRNMTPVTENPHAAVRPAGDPLIGIKKEKHANTGKGQRKIRSKGQDGA